MKTTGATAVATDRETKKLNAIDQTVVAEAGSFATQIRVVEKHTQIGNPYLQFQKKFWNPQKKASEMTMVNLFESEGESLGNKVLANAFQKMADHYRMKWAQEVKEAEKILNNEAEESA